MSITSYELDCALMAFGSDASYAGEILKACGSVLDRRRKWKAREMIEDASRVAREQCIRSATRCCGVLDPCGTNHCPWRVLEIDVETKMVPGKSERPAENSVMKTYDIKPYVHALAASLP